MAFTFDVAEKYIISSGINGTNQDLYFKSLMFIFWERRDPSPKKAIRSKTGPLIPFPFILILYLQFFNITTSYKVKIPTEFWVNAYLCVYFRICLIHNTCHNRNINVLRFLKNVLRYHSVRKTGFRNAVCVVLYCLTS